MAWVGLLGFAQIFEIFSVQALCATGKIMYTDIEHSHEPKRDWHDL